MSALHPLRWARALCVWALLALPLSAGAAQLVVPYLPTPQNVVDRMLALARVGPGDYLIDLGSGDGRIVITAARKYAARGFGVDLDPQRVREANENAVAAGVTDKVAFYERDLFATDLSQATVITLYLFPRVNRELRPRLLDLKPGTRIVSHDFFMGDWSPDAQAEIPAPGKYGSPTDKSEIYLWIVPAKVAGTWRWNIVVHGKTVVCELDAEQKFQNLFGAVRIGGQRVRIEGARIDGDRIEFAYTADIDGTPVRQRYSGQVDGSSIKGLIRLDGATLQSLLEWDAEVAR